MKKQVCVWAALLACGLWVPSASWAKEAAPSSKPAASSKSDSKLEQRRKMIEAKKAELNGSEWEVALLAGDGKTPGGKDVLTFQNGQVRSKIYLAQGYGPTNYTITVEEGNDVAIWETMQTGPKEGVVFIRGEWKESEMRGIISQQVEGGKTKDYSFSTASKVSVSPTATESVDKKQVEKKVEPVKKA